MFFSHLSTASIPIDTCCIIAFAYHVECDLSYQEKHHTFPLQLELKNVREMSSKFMGLSAAAVKAKSASLPALHSQRTSCLIPCLQRYHLKAATLALRDEWVDAIVREACGCVGVKRGGDDDNVASGRYVVR